MDEPPDDTSGAREPLPVDRTPRTIDRGVAVTALVVAIMVMWGIRASTSRWIPTGDDAFLSLRTRHVLSSDPILLNNASSAGPSAGSQYNHPGAFPLTLLSPVTLLGGPGSLALATALVNAAWVALISWMVRRVAGLTAQLGSVLATGLLVWSMGATFVVDPWNPNYGILPVAAMVVAAWGARLGHTRMLAVAVVAASVAFQTHLSLTVLSAAVAAWALLGAVVDGYRARRDRRTDDLRRIVGALGLAVAVGLVANAQMLADQFFGSGNLGKIIGGTGFKEATVSIRQIAAVLASKLIIPPMWLRGSWDGPVLPADEPSAAVVLIGLVIVAGLTVVAIWRARRRERAIVSLFGVLGVALVSALLVATRFPLRIGIPLPYFRWVWPLAAVWASGVVAALAPDVARAARAALPTPARPAVWSRLIVVAVVLAAALQAASYGIDEHISPNPAWAQDISRDFSAAAVRETDERQPVVIDQSIQEAALWVIPALMDQLDAAGIDVRADDAVLIQQTDEAYRATGDEQWHLAVRGGLQIDDAPPGGREIARHDALAGYERSDLDSALARLRPVLSRPGAIRLTATGRAETDAADLEHLTTGELPVEELLRSVPFRLAFDRGAIEAPGVDRDDLRRALDLGALDGGRSIALYLYGVP